MLHLQTLGALRLRADEGELLAGRRKELALLAYLCRRGAAGATRAELATLLWEERDEARARHSLRQALLALRRATGELVCVEEERTRVATGTVDLDVERFEAEIAAGEPEAAIARWQGEFLPGMDEAGGEMFRLWLEGERARLAQQLRSALDAWTAEAAATGVTDLWVERTERYAALFPWDAEAEMRHLEALRSAGRAPEALARYASFAARAETAGDPLPAAWNELADQLRRDQPQPAPPRARASSGMLFLPDLVGREAVLAELRNAWSRTAGGESATVILTGEAGMGKTRLLDEFVRELEQSGEEALVLRARAYEAEREQPWALARELLAPLRAAPGLGGAANRALAEVAPLVPGLRERFPALPPATGDERAVREAAIEVLRSVAEEVPIAICVDDLLFADPASLRLLHLCGRRLGQVPVLLLATVRTGEPDASALTGEPRDLPHAHRIDLKPLTLAETRLMLAAMLPLPADEQDTLAAQLHLEAGGNPLYSYELTAALVEEGHLAPDASGRWRLAVPTFGALPLPAGIRQVVALRLSQLSESAHTVLRAAAVLGERFDVQRLEPLVPLTGAILSAALDELLSRRLIRGLIGRPGSYAFTHSLIRRVAHERVLPAERNTLLQTESAPAESWYHRFWHTPDAVAIDAGSEGEWLAARARIVITLVLLLPPVANFVDEQNSVYLMGLLASGASVLIAATLYLVLRRNGYRPWLGFVSTAFDVSLVSAALGSFALVGDVETAALSRWVFHVYYLALIGASLRYDPRICIVAGGIALVEYSGLIVYTAAIWGVAVQDEKYDWVTQASRLILLFLSALLSWELVRRARDLRHLATYDRVTGLLRRTSFEARAAVELARARREGTEVAVLVVAVPTPDNPHARRDRAATNESLRTLADWLRAALGATAVLGRYEADSLVALLPDTSTAALAGRLATFPPELARLLHLRTPEAARLRMGSASFPDDGADLELLIHQAEARVEQG